MQTSKRTGRRMSAPPREAATLTENRFWPHAGGHMGMTVSENNHVNDNNQAHATIKSTNQSFLNCTKEFDRSLIASQLVGGAAIILAVLALLSRQDTKRSVRKLVGSRKVRDTALMERIPITTHIQYTNYA